MEEGAGGVGGRPLVSVVIPFYNRVELLPRALRSVLGQTFKDLEVVLVDDGSTEDAHGLLANYDDDRVRYVKHDTNRGVSAARNTGIKAARGKYISFLDSDDEWHPTKAEKQVAILEDRDGEPLICYCHADAVYDESGKFIGGHAFDKEGDILHDALLGTSAQEAGACLCVIMNMIMLDRERMLATGGFDESLRLHEDWEMLIRLAAAFRFICVREVLVMNHKHDQGHTANAFEDVPRVRHAIMEKHKKLYQADRMAASHFYSELAYFEALNGLRGKAMLSLCRSVAFQPSLRDPLTSTYLLMLKKVERPRTEF